MLFTQPWGRKRICSRISCGLDVTHYRLISVREDLLHRGRHVAGAHRGAHAALRAFPGGGDQLGGRYGGEVVLKEAETLHPDDSADVLQLPLPLWLQDPGPPVTEQCTSRNNGIVESGIRGTWEQRNELEE